MGHKLHLPDVPETATSAGRWQPLNGPLGVTNFGVNAVAIEPGEVIDIEHDEVDSLHQEVYVVVAGRAAFRSAPTSSRPARATSSRSPTRPRRGTTGRSSRARGSSASAQGRAPSIPTGSGSARSERRPGRRASEPGSAGCAEPGSRPSPLSEPGSVRRPPHFRTWFGGVCRTRFATFAPERTTDLGSERWGREDSNLRRLSRRVYSPFPLAARAHPLEARGL